MTEIQTHTITAKVRVACSVQHVDLTNKLVAFKLGLGPPPELPDQDIPPQLRDKLSYVVSEGVATKKAMLDFLAGRATSIKTQEVRLGHPELRDALRREGFTTAFELLHKRKLEPTSPTPFTDITENGATAEHLIRLDVGNHMAFDVEGNSLPVAMYFDYIQAHMSDGAYDLQKAADILAKDERIRFIEPQRRSYGSGPIYDVPGYNARPGSTRYLPFWFMPTVDDARRLWEKQKSYGGQYPSTKAYQAVFDMDMLGLRAGGAALFDEFHKSTEYVDEED